jgi:hypothetical protein
LEFWRTHGRWSGETFFTKMERPNPKLCWNWEDWRDPFVCERDVSTLILMMN